MALRVVGHVDERAADRCWQLLAAHAARSLKIGGPKDSHSLCCIGERNFDLGQKFGQSLAASLFGFERCQLLGRELLPLRIAQNPVN